MTSFGVTPSLFMYLFILTSGVKCRLQLLGISYSQPLLTFCTLQSDPSKSNVCLEFMYQFCAQKIIFLDLQYSYLHTKILFSLNKI